MSPFVGSIFSILFVACLQEVWGLKCEQLLTSGSALTSECVSMLVELTANPHTEPSLKSSIISLLAQLGRVQKLNLTKHVCTIFS